MQLLRVLWVLASCVSCPTGLAGSKPLGHKKFVAGPLQPRRETLQGKCAGLVESPPRLQRELGPISTQVIIVSYFKVRFILSKWEVNR